MFFYFNAITLSMELAIHLNNITATEPRLFTRRLFSDTLLICQKSQGVCFILLLFILAVLAFLSIVQSKEKLQHRLCELKVLMTKKEASYGD